MSSFTLKYGVHSPVEEAFDITVAWKLFRSGLTADALRSKARTPSSDINSISFCSFHNLLRGSMRRNVAMKNQNLIARS
jgi:hypothetical protein